MVQVQVQVRVRGREALAAWQAVVPGRPQGGLVKLPQGADGRWGPAQTAVRLPHSAPPSRRWPVGPRHGRGGVGPVLARRRDLVASRAAPRQWRPECAPHRVVKGRMFVRPSTLTARSPWHGRAPWQHHREGGLAQRRWPLGSRASAGALRRSSRARDETTAVTWLSRGQPTAGSTCHPRGMRCAGFGGGSVWRT